MKQIYSEGWLFLAHVFLECVSRINTIATLFLALKITIFLIVFVRKQCLNTEKFATIVKTIVFRQPHLRGRTETLALVQYISSRLLTLWDSQKVHLRNRFCPYRFRHNNQLYCLYTDSYLLTRILIIKFSDTAYIMLFSLLNKTKRMLPPLQSWRTGEDQASHKDPKIIIIWLCVYLSADES
jgi:hypothetical protein